MIQASVMQTNGVPDVLAIVVHKSPNLDVLSIEANDAYDIIVHTDAECCVCWTFMCAGDYVV